jgi:gluconokinase
MKNPAYSGGESRPLLVVVMGVSGAGKTTVSQALAEQCGYLYLDADDFHSIEARARMAAGMPLTDEMRKPWVDAICRRLCELAKHNVNVVLAFSGLRRAHREPLRHCDYQVQFLFLEGERETISARIQARTGHFMPSSLLDSQFACLERPDAEVDVHTLNIISPLAELLLEANKVIKERRAHS